MKFTQYENLNDTAYISTELFITAFEMVYNEHKRALRDGRILDNKYLIEQEKTACGALNELLQQLNEFIGNE